MVPTPVTHYALRRIAFARKCSDEISLDGCGMDTSNSDAGHEALCPLSHDVRTCQSRSVPQLKVTLEYPGIAEASKDPKNVPGTAQQQSAQAVRSSHRHSHLHPTQRARAHLTSQRPPTIKRKLPPGLLEAADMMG